MTLTTWASKRGIKLEYIQPGKPQQNAYIERFNRTARYEWLSQYEWEDLLLSSIKNGGIIEVRILDHIIVASSTTASFAERGLL